MVDVAHAPAVEADAFLDVDQLALYACCGDVIEVFGVVMLVHPPTVC
jgi:hypothetical protein